MTPLSICESFRSLNKKKKKKIKVYININRSIGNYDFKLGKVYKIILYIFVFINYLKIIKL